MEYSIDYFIERFGFYQECIEYLKERCFNEATGKYKKCGIDVYRQLEEKKKPLFYGVWFLDFNKNTCSKKKSSYWY